MRRLPEAASAGLIVFALVVAMVLAPLVRGVTTGMTLSLGQVWPFSLAHCHAKSTPGCGPGPVTFTATR